MRAVLVLAAAGLLLRSPPAPDALVTVPQGDQLRSRLSPPSIDMTADGRFVAFVSYAQLSPEDDDQRSDIYVLDRATHGLTLESPPFESPQRDGDCDDPQISADGRHLAFVATLPHPVAGTPMTEVVLRDRTTGTFARAPRNRSGELANGWSSSPALSQDGRTLTFVSAATNLVPERDDNGALPDVFALDLASRAIRRIGVDQEGGQPQFGAVLTSSISADGRYVAFVAAARPPSAADAARRAAAPRVLAQAYVRDLVREMTTPIAPRSPVPNGSSSRAQISADGRFVAFVSNASNLVQDDRNRSTDVFVWNAQTGAISLISRNIHGRPANGTSGNPAISADGRYVAFQSDASDLVCVGNCRPPRAAPDFNLLSDVFVLDRETGAMSWVSTGGPQWMEESLGPALDASGAVVAFTSRHPTHDRDVRNDFDLFVRVLR